MKTQRWFTRSIPPVALAALLAALGCAGSSGGSSSSGGSDDGSGDDGGTSTTLTITAQPQSVKEAVGTTGVALSVTATGSGTLTYQWYKGGAAISGATGASYSIGTLAAAHAGRYHVLITDATGSLASDTVTVTPLSGGVPVDAWDLNDGFDPADEVGNYTFPYTVTLSGTSTPTGTGFSSASSSGTATTFTTSGGETVVVDVGTTPITVVSGVSGYVRYVVGGSFSTGVVFSSTLTSPMAFGLTLSGATIASSVAGITVTPAVRTFVAVEGTNSVSGGLAGYGAIYSAGSLLFSGSGSLAVTGQNAAKVNAISAAGHVRLAGATLTLKTTYNPSSKSSSTKSIYDLVAGTGFVMDGGTLTASSADAVATYSLPSWGRGVGVKGLEATTGVESGMGFIVVNGGTLTIDTFDKAMTAKWKCYDKDTPADGDGNLVCDANDPDPFITINGGTITIATTGTPCDPADSMTYNGTTCTGSTSASVSPEGIEAKSVLTINGGTISIETPDDAVNAGISYANGYTHGNAIVVNGGYVYAASSDNDGMDCNAVASPGITVNGGVVIANGIGAPEEGFDPDQYTVAFNGGLAIGTGGGNGAVDTGSEQDYAKVTSLSSGKTLAIWEGSSSSGSLVFAYQIPSATAGNASSNLQAVISSAELVAGGTYQYFFTDASSVTCSSWFHGLCIGSLSATYSSLGTAHTLTVQ